MLDRTVLDLDRPRAVASIAASVRRIVLEELRRRGVVVGLSGGIDSSTVAALCVRALGPERVHGVFMPERDSSDDSLRLGRALADALGIETTTVSIAPALEALGCYRERDDAVASVLPGFTPSWRWKIVLPPVGEGARLNVFHVVARTSDGDERRARLPLAAYLRVVAATNMKQRTRKLLEYFHAERRNYAVAGTPNRLEYDQGFFVKYGDGAADLKPIAHLYKTQVYALAEELGVPEEIRRRPPTTDTYSLEQGQDEFYYLLPYGPMDLCLWGRNHGVPAAEVAAVTDLTTAQVEQVYRDIEAKRRATRYLHLPPVLVEEVAELA